MSDRPIDDEARQFHERLRELSDEDLDRFGSQIDESAVRLFPSGMSREDFDSDPVYRLWVALVCMASNEESRRRVMIHRMEADLQGGHLVEVLEGRKLDTYSAVCDPRLEDDATISCWAGPDRATVEEAVADARAHHPGYEPRVLVDPENPW